MMHKKTRVVILSTADFESPVWTNKQHLAVGLAENHEVIYIESLGLRQPTVSFHDGKRMIKKFRQVLTARLTPKADMPSDITKGVRVISPRVIPFHKYAVVRRINAALIQRQLRWLSTEASSAVLWTFSPITYGLERHFGKTVYHSVDLLHTIPGVPTRTVLTAEKSLINAADEVVASSIGVRDHLREAGFDKVKLWENVAHFDIFASTRSRQRKDQVVFAGNLTPTKIDLDCFESLLEHGLKVAVAGPIGIDGSGENARIEQLLRHPRVTYHGNLDLSALAELFAESKVGLIPYSINDYTRGVFPMKVYEYLASGLSVLSTPLPNLTALNIETMSLVSPRDFGAQAEKLIAGHGIYSIQASRQAAEGRSWTARVKEAASLIAASGENGCDSKDLSP